MPRYDDAARSTARERSQARMGRMDGSRSRTSSNSYERARQQRTSDRSQSRYARQAPRQTSESSRSQERAYRSSRQNERDTRRTSRSTQGRSSRTDQQRRYSDDRARSYRSDQRQRSRADQRRQTQAQPTRAGSILEKLPSWAVPVGIAAVAVIVLLFLIFGVLAPSCSRTEAPAQNGEPSSNVTVSQGIVHVVSQAAATTKTSVQTANQVGSLETSNGSVQALVTLLGEEEAATLPVTASRIAPAPACPCRQP